MALHTRKYIEVYEIYEIVEMLLTLDLVSNSMTDQ